MNLEETVSLFTVLKLDIVDLMESVLLIKT